MIFFNFYSKNTPNITSELNDDFFEDFFEVLNIFLGQKIFVSKIVKVGATEKLYISKNSLEDNQQ